MRRLFANSAAVVVSAAAMIVGAPLAAGAEEPPPRKTAAALPDLALLAPKRLSPEDPEHTRSARGSQGVPGIERTAKGRLWATWYAGKSRRGVESPFSYVVLATSADDGVTWTETMILQPVRYVRAMDPCLWIDPQGRLWFFWAQCAGLQDGRWGVWSMTTADPEATDPKWTEPRRIANGIMLNKPTVLKNEDWLLPVGLWRRDEPPILALERYDLSPYTPEMLVHDLGEERGTNVIRSRDRGKTFEFLGQARVPNTRVDEHMLVERRDGSLWMLMRNTAGIAQSISTDGGRTWDAGSIYLKGKPFANKRFFVRRLESGALLMVRNDGPTGARTHMTAFVSDDDGATWSGGFVLDERESSYPDGTQAENGDIYLIYDHERYTQDREGREGAGAVLMAVFREEDARAGRAVTDAVRLQVNITRLRPESESPPR